MPPNRSSTSSFPTRTVYFIPSSFTFGLMSAYGDCTVMASICTSLPRNSSAILLNFGTSDQHGSHHVAQKSTTEILPFRSAALTLPPATFSSSKSGAGPLSCIGALSLVEAGRDLHANRQRAIVKAKAILLIVFYYNV